MTDPTNDIDALLRYLKSGHTPHWYDDSTRWHAALTALVAERDALRQRVEELESHKSVSVRLLIEERDALRQRVAELESQPADRDLRAEIDKLSGIVSILTCRVAALESAKFFGPHVPVNPWNPYPTTPWITYGTRTSDRIEESA